MSSAPVIPDIRSVAEFEEIERTMLQETDARLDIQVAHHFSSGVYVREAFLPKGSLVLGHAHKKECINICLSGSLMLRINGELVRIDAPCVFKSPPGVRKLAYVVEDVRWLNIHPTEETDLAKIEDEVIEKSPIFLEHHTKELQS